jgi:hypothetical protein
LVWKISVWYKSRLFDILLTCIFQSENRRKFQESFYIIGHPESNHNQQDILYNKYRRYVQYINIMDKKASMYYLFPFCDRHIEIWRGLTNFVWNLKPLLIPKSKIKKTIIMIVWIYTQVFLSMIYIIPKNNRVSDCCLTPNKQLFSYTMARANYIEWNDDVRFVLNQHL